MTQKNLFPTVTLSQEDTPVSRLVSQESKRMKMTATSGRTCIKLLHKKDPLMQFSKMFMVTLDWASTRCSLTWKPKVTPQGRLLFQLVPSMLHIEETDCGLWPTPTASTNGHGTDRNNPRGIQQGNALATAVVWKAKGWWPISSKKEHKEVRGTTEAEWNRGSLNPTWVEWLMGYPKGWTDLED